MLPSLGIDQNQLEAILGQSVKHWRPSPTDCSYPSFIAETEQQSYFIKWSDTPTTVFQKEATGLQQLQAAYPAVPKVHSFSDQSLVLDFIKAAPTTPVFWRNLGEGLAQLHQSTKPHFGFFEDNSIGRASQSNTPISESWADFFWNQRIQYKLDQIHSRHQESFKASLLDSVKTEIIKSLTAHQPKPCLVHGDLWSGNVLCSSDQKAFLIDPAVYFGDRETDLAMTECFGGFPDAFYQAYNQAFALESGYEERKHIYNLYHMLNHYLIFGESYKMSCLQIMEIIID